MNVKSLTPTDLLNLADAIRAIQHRLNCDEVVAGPASAWGDLDRAMERLIKRHFDMLGVAKPGPLAQRIVDASYETGEPFAHLIKLWVKGEITVHDGATEE